MFMTETNTPKMHVPKDMFDQPINVICSYDDSYWLLLAALDIGWQVKEPVLLSPRRNEGGKWVFHFTLKQPSNDQLCVITSYWSPEIELFVRKEGWQVDRNLDIAQSSSLI